jgi:hypothetical protein
VTLPPAQNVVGPLAVTSGVGVGVMATFTDALFAHAPAVTVTESPTLPVAPALNVIAAVPCPLTIVPFVIDHE